MLASVALQGIGVVSDLPSLLFLPSLWAAVILIPTSSTRSLFCCKEGSLLCFLKQSHLLNYVSFTPTVIMKCFSCSSVDICSVFMGMKRKRMNLLGHAVVNHMNKGLVV